MPAVPAVPAVPCASPVCFQVIPGECPPGGEVEKANIMKHVEVLPRQANLLVLQTLL